MSPHLSVAVVEPSQVGEARRTAVRLATEHGLDEATAGRLALVVTELGTNLTRHAQGGTILLAARELGAGRRCIEVLAVDHGPGMADLQRCLRDGYSTGGTPGTGLGAVRRLADEFSAYSMPGQGTVVVARVAAPPGHAAVATLPAVAAGIVVGAIAVAAPGETVCGDGYAYCASATGGAVIVADGLGHGPDAHAAALAALAVFEAGPGQAPAQMIERAHAAMRATRGAAVAVAQLDAGAGSVVFAGAGNVAGRLISGVGDRSLLSQHGTVGLQIRHLKDIRYDWPDHAVLVLHSDGIQSRWQLGDAAGVLQCDPSVIAGWILRGHLRGRDDATVVVVRRR